MLVILETTAYAHEYARTFPQNVKINYNQVTSGREWGIFKRDKMLNQFKLPNCIKIILIWVCVPNSFYTFIEGF